MRARRLRRSAGLLFAMLGVAVSLLAVPLPAGAGDAAAGWYRVAFADRITQADRDVLDALGAQGVQYVPTDAYVAWLTAAAAEEAARLDQVAGVAPVAPADKIHPYLPRAGVVRVAVLVHERGRSAVAAFRRATSPMTCGVPATSRGWTPSAWTAPGCG